MQHFTIPLSAEAMEATQASESEIDCSCAFCRQAPAQVLELVRLARQAALVTSSVIVVSSIVARAA